MEIFIFLIPFVVAAFLLIFFRKQTTWWEYAVLIVPSILMEFVFKQSNAADTEYLGPIVEKEWHRKNFEDFDYLTIELTDVQYWAIIIILLIFNIVMSSWIVTNNYKNDL